MANNHIHRNVHVFEDLRPIEASRQQKSAYSDATFAASTYPTRSQLPINLVLLIISHVHDITTLAAVTRASRLLYYLTLPRLYEHITLNAYSSIRYVDDQPEGFGGGSPFAMGLDALVSSPNNVAQYVKEMTLRGSWKETDAQDFAKGRVPDNTMMLNIVIRAAVARAGRLERFNWALDTKPMKTVYQGLALRNSLTHFRLRFPSSRIPRPAVLIPAIPSLKSLVISNLDPLCYNDDVSLLISQARQLQELQLHWSRRMRNAREPSVYLQYYLGQLAEAPYKLRLRDMQMINMFTRNDGTLGKCFDFESMESIAFLNCMETDDPSTVFIDNSWLFEDNNSPMTCLRRLRMDRIDKTFPRIIKHFKRLDEIYVISGQIARDRADRKSQHQHQHQPPPLINGSSDSLSPVSAASSPLNGDATGFRTAGADAAQTRVTIAEIPGGSSTPTASTASNNRTNTSTTLAPMDWTASPDLASTSPTPAPAQTSTLTPKIIAIASDAIAALTCRGAQMRKLLLPARWTLGNDVVLHLASSCPNLEQLGLAMDVPSPEFMRELLKRLPKLTALRVLLPPQDSEVARTMAASVPPGLQLRMLEAETWRDEYMGLLWLGMGSEIVRLCGREKISYISAAAAGSDAAGAAGEEPRRERYRGLVKSVEWDEVRHVEIFGLDSLEE